MGDFFENEIFLLLAFLFVVLALVLYNRSRIRRKRNGRQQRSFRQRYKEKKSQKEG